MDLKAYISVLSNDSYLLGVLCLKKSLDLVNSKYPLYILLTNEVSEEVEDKLNKYQIKTIRKDKINLPSSIINKNNSAEKSRWNYTFDKLNIFELVQFDKLVFIDSDIYIRKNIDNLFDMPHMSAVIDKYYGPNITPRYMKLTSGIMVIEPKAGIIKEFEKIIENILNKRYAIGDQDILQEYDTEWHNKKQLHLKNKYNIFFPYLEYYINCQEYMLDDINAIHFIYTKKPWMFKGDTKINDYLDYVNNFTLEDYKKTNILEIKDCLLCGFDNMNSVLKEYFKILNELENTMS